MTPETMGRGWTDVLSDVPLFSGLSKRHLNKIAEVAQSRRFPRFSTIVRTGERGDIFFVILDGKAKVVRSGRTIARLEPGNFFGEISLLDGGPRTATVLAETDLRCLDLAREDFREMLEGEPAVALRVVKELARRLRGYENPPVG